MDKYLGKCLKSLLAQDYTYKELIFVDDGSTDDTAALIDEYSRKYECVKAYHKQNGGVASARNYGMDKASGKYMMFIDPDDYVLSNFISAALTCAEKEKADVAYFGYRTPWYTDPPVMQDYKPLIKGAVHGHDAIMENVFPLFCGMTTYGLKLWMKSDNNWNKNRESSTIWRCIYRTDFINSNHLRFRNLASGEDMVFNLDAIALANVVAATDEVTYVYLPFQGGLLSTGLKSDKILKNKTALLEQRNRLRRFFKEKESRDILPNYAGSCAMCALQTAYELSLSGKYSDWMTYINAESVKEGIRLVPFTLKGSIKRWLLVAMLKIGAYRLLFYTLRFARRHGIAPDVW